ncbi:ABC transporter ATP-binding protein [Parvularcula maris]|uniref:ATP-binding cassette domain-containing protein n=1 Tax=Parvularcula maris TaxID=2965077 RepID=A0A9X2RI71_9PROT|nr:ATP-binding cassette domain-containing protein [Parvularcula maris]MCQ8185730.1 ATP-binding cassette domain-containing protein [Parvularcula maris]
MAEQKNVIEVRDLKNQFGKQVVHDDLDLDVREREILGVVGGSGTGKSVLLRSIVGLQTPKDGQIHVLGRQIFPRKATAREINEDIGILFQDGALFSSMTVSENVMAPLREHHPEIGDQLAQEIAGMKLSLSGLSEGVGGKMPSELSGGMRKRVALARAMALDPRILFLDEPTAGLDPIGAARFDELIISLKENLGLTIFMVTHDLDSLNRACDRVAVLAEKKVIVNASLDEVRRSNHPWIGEYFGGPRGRAAAGANLASGAA